jgi:hypothetical protein
MVSGYNASKSGSSGTIPAVFSICMPIKAVALHSSYNEQCCSTSVASILAQLSFLSPVLKSEIETRVNVIVWGR